MKTEKNKKGKESTIGKIIYGFLLFMPLIAIGTSILVNTFNIDAKNEVLITYEYESNEVNTNNDLINGNAYHFNYNKESIPTIAEYIGDSVPGNIYISGKFLKTPSVQITGIDQTYTDDTFDYTQKTPFGLIFESSSTYLDIYSIYQQEYQNYSVITYINEDYYTYNFDFIFDEIVINTDNQEHRNDIQDYIDNVLINKITQINQEDIPIKEIQQKDITNIFYDSIDKVEDSTLFNWSKNSIIYTTLLATCTQLSITTTFIPMLLAYWLIISVIYILYDIALIMLHIFHKKVHCIEDAV